MAESKNGWTARTEGTTLRRSDFPPEHFYDESMKADPAAAAWDEPGYIDPDLSHGSLDVGTRYWQGFAKAAMPRAPEGERAMSPGWVAEVTESEAGEAPQKLRESPDAEDTAFDDTEIDPLRERVVRQTESKRPQPLIPG